MKQPLSQHGERTRQRILDAAESLFARQGFQIPSIRDITAQAKVNLAAVHYHFRNKQGLILAVLERRIRPVNEERVRLLEEYLASLGPGGRPELECVIRSFIAPAVALRRPAKRRGADLVRLMGRLHLDVGETVPPLMDALLRPVAERYLAVIERLTPHLAAAERATRLRFCVGAMSFTMQTLDSPWTAGLRMEVDDEALVREFGRFLAAGLLAPPAASRKAAGQRVVAASRRRGVQE